MSLQQAKVLPDFGPVFRTLPGMYAVLSPELTILEVTDAYLKARYTSRSHLKGTLLSQTFSGTAALLNMPPMQALEQSLEHVLLYKTAHHIPTFCYNVKLPSVHGGGLKELFWSVTHTPVFNDDGELLYILHEARDIADKSNSTPGTPNQEHIAMLANTVNAVSWEYDLVHNKMYWGQGLEKIFGYTPEEMGEGGESWDERVHPEDFAAVQESIERANASGSKIWSGEYRFRKADGNYIPVLDQGYIIYHTDGRPIRTLGSIIDLSENHKSKEVTKEGDARFRHLLEVLPHIAWMAEPSGKISYFNKNWYSYTGMPANQTDGWTNVIHPEDTATVLTEWHNSLANGMPYETEYRLRNHHDKTYRWFLERGVPMHDAEGNLQFWIGTLTDIEEQKQAMERMREKDLQLENILNNSPAHLCLLHGPEHICDYVTPGFTILYGNRQYLHKPAREIWPELQHTNFISILDNVYRSGKRVQIHEHKLAVDRKRNGQFTDMYLNLEYRPLITNGVTAGILVSAVEVTELVQTKQRIAFNQQSMQLLSEAAGCATWEYDVKGKIITWSSGYKEMFGYTDADLTTDAATWDANIHPEDYQSIRASVNSAIANSKKSWTGEYRYRRADGSYAYVMDHGYIIYDKDSMPERMLGSVLDITSKKKNDQELQYNNERFKRIAMATNDVIWDWNLQDDSIWWSEGYSTLFGYKEYDIEVDINSWTDHIHPDDLALIKSSIKKAFDGSDNSWEGEYRFRCADGSYKLIHDKGYIIRDTHGKAIRMFGSMLDVTEKRQIEQQLQVSNSRTLEILESLPLLTWTTTPDGSADYYNQRWYNYTGSNFEEMKVNGWKNLIHPDDLEETSRLWQEAVTSGNNFEVENRWKCAADGQYRWFLARAVPIRNSEGEITMWVGSHTEIEDQKQIMFALEEGTNKFRYLTESSPQIVWSANPDGNIDFTSKQWYDYTNMTIEESLGYGWAPAIHPDDLQMLLDNWTHSITTGDPFYVEVRVRNVLTDIYQWFIIKAQATRNNNGDIIKWYGVGLHIHDIKMLQQQLEESEKQMRFMADSIPQMIWTTRPDGHHDYFNKRWMDYTGLTLEESIGLVWNDMLHPDDKQRAWDRWQYSLRTGEYYEIEYRFKNGFNGSYRWFLGQAMPMRDAQGNIVKWFGTCTDIEDHKKAEEELVDKNLELERINQDLDNFVYTASHDLKLPIVNMAGIFNELTLNTEFKDPDAPELIGMFNKSLEQIYNTINDLAEVVKVQKSHIREYEQVNLQELTEDVKVSIQDTLVATDTKIMTDFSEVPSLAFGKANLKSILYNLISNAIKYRKQDQKPQISISTSRKGDYVELKIQDNGIGIDMNKHQNKLFQMFKRFHNHVSGSGLGLYIVNRLLTNSGGYINIESRLNEGTTFFLYFKQKKV
ncbi:PAS domain-containing protein [Pontibacter sp. KCTC 32443]|uniref:PAS domain-containing protein n=1 Tax=Pontibacter TaxID=323449 RepID=UPI00164E0551|nr:MULTISPECIES: PAS domain-containing protein [Pontibacter]MBC5774269.1 PAS domain-containing protein [Pontibacter sp. KCTC 32443]